MNHKFYITYADLPLSAAPRAWVEVDAEAIRHILIAFLWLHQMKLM